MSTPHNATTHPQRLARMALAMALALALVGAFALSRGASAQDLQSRLDEKQAELQQAKERKGVLSSELQRYSDQVDQLRGEVAVLRNREAIVAEQLRRVQSRLREEKIRLEQLQAHLKRSLAVLRNRLVAIYRSDRPDLLTVLLESDGFDSMVSRFEYLRRIEEQDADIVSRVRSLRDDSRETVARIEETRNEIAAKKAELERTRIQLEQRERQLAAVRNRKASALEQVRGQIERLEGDIGDIQQQIQAQIQAAQAESSGGAEPLPAGPVQGGQNGWIWPVNGTVSSPFGPRWGRMHEGIDISAPAGTPIRAAKAGKVILAAPTSGYGNYTCVDHGGGISSCYAHQSSYAAGVGDSLSQGEVLGYVGCTGSCFGDHLHFEIRVNGAAVDPLGYL